VTATLYDVCFYVCVPPNRGLITLGYYTARLIFIGVAQESHRAMFDFCVVRMFAYL
jgi:hypothetical protein